MIALLSACSVERPIHTCDEWSDCGVGGACEPARELDAPRACSFIDTACSSGRRFSRFAPGELADACVEIRPSAKRGELCAPGPNACDDLRECLGNRCVTVESLSANSNFFGAHCANPMNHYAPLTIWGNTSFAQIEPASPAFNACDVRDCPKMCWECKLDCPTDCAANPPQDPEACMTCDDDCPTTDVCGVTFVYSASVGDNHYCINNGQTYCFGANDTYQLGNPIQTANNVFNGWWLKASCNTEVPPDCVGKPYANVVAGIAHTCASFPFGADVECWGDNSHGQRGPSQGGGPADPVLVQPFPLEPGQEPLTVGLLSASGVFTCAATSERVACWGETPTSPEGIVTELSGGSFTWLDTGAHHACVIDAGRVTCWGANDAGQSAPDDPAANVRPTVVLPELEFASVAAGRLHTCAVTTTGLTYCWGDGSLGQLGPDAMGPGPVLLDTPTAVGPIASGDDSTCALHLDDHVRCWGDVVQIGTETYDDLEPCLRPDL